MGTIIQHQPFKLFSGIIHHKKQQKNGIIERLQKEFGNLDFVSDSFDFKHTVYYQNEMGLDLERFFVSFESRVMADSIYKAKLLSNCIEDDYAINKQRTVNIDPGIITPHNVILLTTKNFSHRIPLQQGIYAELTLMYDSKIKQYTALPWTYPDFQTKEYMTALLHIRSL
jgi:hypothetical protein